LISVSCSSCKDTRPFHEGRAIIVRHGPPEPGHLAGDKRQVLGPLAGWHPPPPVNSVRQHPPALDALAGVGWGIFKGDQTRTAIIETLNIMKSLRKEIPPEDLELKRLDALNSFVFNVDTPAELVEVYGRYHMRGEPLDTLERIQDAYIGASKEDLLKLAAQLLDPAKIQIFIVADKKIAVKGKQGGQITLEEDLTQLAQHLGLPFKEVKLR